MTKICSRCKKEKDLEEFYVRNSSKDGRRCYCKSCGIKDSKKYCQKMSEKNSKNTTSTGIVHKKCSSCKQKKHINKFGKCKRNKDGFNNSCKKCRSVAKKKWYKNAVHSVFLEDTISSKICSLCKKEKPINEFYRSKVIKNRISRCISCCRKESEIKWATDAKYRKISNKKSKAYRLKHKDDIREKKRVYRNNHREERNLNEINLRRLNVNYRILHNLRSILRNAIKNQYGKKSERTIELLGCSIVFLKKYIELKFSEGMNWNNYGKKGWHIDHIKPCVMFNLTDPKEQKKCFRYTNLQPLWENDNLKKHSFYKNKCYRKITLCNKKT